MDLTGKWNFSEDFSFGKDKGVVRLTQLGNILTGELEFTESIEEATPFKVKCLMKGSVEGKSVKLNVVSFQILESQEPIDYYPETREGIVNDQGQIVGSSEDEQGICGVFVMDRCQYFS